MADDARKGGCLKLAGIGLGALFALGVIVTVIGETGGTAPEATPGAGPAAPPPIAITARALFAAYDANEVAAMGRFGGQRLAVTGTISGVTLDMFDNPVVELDSGNEFQAVQAKFGKDDAAEASALKKGQEITVICAKVTEVIGSPILDDCALP